MIAAAAVFLALPEGQYGKMFPFVYRGMEMGREGGEYFWSTGWDGSAPFLDGTGFKNGSTPGREIGRSIVGKSIGSLHQEFGREHSFGRITAELFCFSSPPPALFPVVEKSNTIRQLCSSFDNAFIGGSTRTIIYE